MAPRVRPRRIRAPGAALVLLLSLAGGAAAQPACSGACDWETDVEIGLASSGNVVTAPFNVTTPPGGGLLYFIEFNSTNAVPFSVKIWPDENYSPVNGSGSGSPLVEAVMVTYFLFDFSSLAVEATPPANHTASAEISAGFANLSTAASAQNYMVVLERRDYAPSQVHVRQDRFGAVVPPRGGLFGLDGSFGAVSLAAMALVAATATARASRPPRER